MRSIALLPLALAAAAAQEATWQPVPCPPARLTLATRFETVRPAEASVLAGRAMAHGQSAQVSVSPDPQGGPGGQPALRVDYEFRGEARLEYVDVGYDLLIPAHEPGAALGLWVRGGQSLPLRARVVDASGECHQFDLLREREGEWTYAALAFDQPTTAWGGDGNRRLDGECHLRSILFDRRGTGYTAKGSLWLAGLAHLRVRESRQEAALAVEVMPARFGNLYRPGETVRLRVRCDAPILRWRWTDFWGRSYREGEAATSPAECALVLPAPGHFVCTLEACRDGQVAGTLGFRCAAMDDLRPDAIPNDVVGFCSHFGHNLAYPLDCMRLLRQYGIRRFRDEISWGSVERQAGQYALPAHAVAWTDLARELGMRPLVILDYSNPLYDGGGYPNSPEAVKGYCDYSAFLARSLKGTVDEFEVWNEWIGGCGMGGRPGDHGPEAYGRLLKETYPAVKAVRPDATVIGIGGEYGDHLVENLLTMARTAGPTAMDAFSIHPYRYPRTPEESGLLAEMQRVADAVAAAGVPRRLWATEIGWPTHATTSGVEESEQARLLVRALSLMQASGAVEKIHLYDFKNDGTQPDYNEHNFGVVLHQSYHCAPKPAAVAVAVYARLTAGAAVQARGEADGLWGVRFRRPDGQDVLVLWTTRPEAEVEVSGDLDRHLDLMGRETPATSRIRVSPNPIYLTGRGLDAPGLPLALVSAPRANQGR